MLKQLKVFWNIQKDISFHTLVVILMILGVIVLMNFPNNVLSWDIFGYYLYLPLVFIYQDLGIRDYAIIQNIIDTYQNTSTFYQAVPALDGTWVMKYPMGMALLYSPWFLVGHIWAAFSTYPSDGFSYPYQASLLYGSYLYTMVGLYFYWKSMRMFFKPATVSILLIVVVFGTNYLFHTVFHGQGLMSHNYLFTLFALILYFTIKWHEKPGLNYAVGLGVTIGMAALSRPTELLVAIVPVLWNITSKADFHAKIQLLMKNWKSVLIAGIIILLFGSLQLIYFKVFTGKFLYNSYGNNAGEGLDFFNPYILQVLISFRKGWLIYTPMMILSLVGFYQLYRYKQQVFYAVLVYFITTFYVISSWSCWWYADCLSQRTLIPAYVFLSLPLGLLIETGLEARKFQKFSLLFVLILFLALNLFQSWQFIHGIIHTSRMTQDYYNAVFLKKTIPPNARDLLLVDRNINPKELFAGDKQFQQTILYEKVFEGTSTGDDNAISDTIPGLKIDPESPNSLSFEISYEKLAINEYGIIEVLVSVLTNVAPDHNPFSLVATFKHKGWDYAHKEVEIQHQDVVLDNWTELSLLYLTPEVRHKSDVFKAYIRLGGSHPVYVRKLKVILHKPV